MRNTENTFPLIVRFPVSAKAALDARVAAARAEHPGFPITIGAVVRDCVLRDLLETRDDNPKNAA